MNIFLKNEPLRACLIGIVLAFVFGSASTAFAQEFKQEWSGWFMFNSDADVNGDMTGGGEQTLSGRGTFGRADNHAASDIVFSGAPCDFDPDTSGLLLEVIAHSNILRARNGDQLFRTMSSSPPSTICFNPVTLIAKLTVYLDVVGGTGRFEGATGSTVLKTQAVVIGPQNSITGTEEGEIFGVARN